MNKIEDFNTKKLMKKTNAVINSLKVVVALLLVSNAFFAYQWQRSAFRDVVYLVHPEATEVTKRSEISHKRRIRWEIENFAEMVTKTTLSHSKQSYDNDMERLFEMVTRPVMAKLLHRFSLDGYEMMYKEDDAISEVAIDHIDTRFVGSEIEVLATYILKVNFLNLKDHPEKKIKGGLFLILTPTKRSKENPYGLTVIDMKFVDLSQLPKR